MSMRADVAARGRSRYLAHGRTESHALDDPDDLARFVAAQGDTYETAVGELRRGRRRSHWMWFVFPQLRGLGHSDMAERYGLSSLDESRAYQPVR